MKAAMGRRLCPFVKKPMKECFCYHLTSRNIEAAVHICGERYTDCAIFRKHFNEFDSLERLLTATDAQR
jgi:hypothetical protein